MAVVAPMASASVMIETAVNPGLRRKSRKAWRRSLMELLPVPEAEERVAVAQLPPVAARYRGRRFLDCRRRDHRRLGTDGTGAVAGVGGGGGGAGLGAGGVITVRATTTGGSGGRTGAAAASFFCVIAFRTSPGREMCDKSILVLISSSPRSGRLDREKMSALPTSRECGPALFLLHGPQANWNGSSSPSPRRR